MKWYMSAVISGLCASSASMFGKLTAFDFLVPDEKSKIILKMVCLCMMIFLNSLMWTFFVKALQKVKKTIEATAINCAANYIFSGIMGYLVFEEILGLCWYLGIIFIVVGVILLCGSGPVFKEETD